MSLVFRIGVCNVHRVVCELRNPLKSCHTESTCHSRIHIGIHNICRVEFVNQACLLVKSFHLIGKRNIIAVYIGKKISLLRLSGYQSDRIPLISSALNGSLIVCFYHIFVVAYIIEDRFTVPGSMNRFQHSVDICLYLFLRTGVARFVIDFKSHYGRIVLIGYSGIRIDMFH